MMPLEPTRPLPGMLLAIDSSGPTLYLGLYGFQPPEEADPEGAKQEKDNKRPSAVITRAQRQFHSDSQRYHSAILMDALDRLLNEGNASLKDVDALAVHVGPGSFTGIRTGLISARALGQFLPLSLYPFNAFELALFTAAPGYPTGQAMQVLLDARRGRAYYAAGVYEAGSFHWQQPPCLLELEAIQPDLPVIASQSLLPQLKTLLPQAPQALALEELYESTSPTKQMAAMIGLAQSNPQPLIKPVSWESLIPLYLESPNITLPKKNPAILTVSDITPGDHST